MPTRILTGQEGSNRAGVDIGQRLRSISDGRSQQPLDIAPIGAHRVETPPPFEGEVRRETIDDSDCPPRQFALDWLCFRDAHSSTVGSQRRPVKHLARVA